MPGWAIALIIVGGVILLLALIIIGYVISTSNWFNRAQVKVKESASGIDVALEKRYDLLTKSLATVKGYTKHESETLTNVIKMRNARGVSNMSMEEKSQFNNAINEAQREINIVMEQYPNLKADSTFTTLQRQIADCEEQLQAARRVYNNNVSMFNQKRVAFPASAIAKRKGLTEDLEFFKAEEHKRQDVKIEF